MPQKSNKRLQAAKVKKETYDEIMTHFDATGDALIDREEAKSLIKALLKEEPDETEIDFMMKIGHDHDTITRQELPMALARMRAIRSERDYLHSMFAKFDVDENGALEAGQLKNLLTEIGEGSPPTDEDITKILDQADHNSSGAIEFTELFGAITVWYLDPAEPNKRLSVGGIIAVKGAEDKEDSKKDECEVKPQKSRYACVIS